MQLTSSYNVHTYAVGVSDIAAREGSPHNVLHSSSVHVYRHRKTGEGEAQQQAWCLGTQLPDAEGYRYIHSHMTFVAVKIHAKKNLVQLATDSVPPTLVKLTTFGSADVE